MKYFTLEWWNGIQELDFKNDPSEEYQEYFNSVKSQLPSAFIQLNEEIYLHDGSVSKLNISSQDNTFLMVINTDDGNGNLRVVSLSYSGLAYFNSTSDPENGFPGPLGFGDYGYDEVEILESGLFEHRILFSSGISFSIGFKDIQLSYKDFR